MLINHHIGLFGFYGLFKQEVLKTMLHTLISKKRLKKVQLIQRVQTTEMPMEKICYMMN